MNGKVEVKYDERSKVPHIKVVLSPDSVKEANKIMEAYKAQHDEGKCPIQTDWIEIETAAKRAAV